MPRDLSRLFVLCASLAVPGTLLLAADGQDRELAVGQRFNLNG